MLSDGVIVIIMTIMVFEIKLPEFSENITISHYYPLMQHIGVYATSFLVLSVMWLNHHHIFIGIERITSKIVWINLLLLFFMSLIPLPTKALGQNIFSISSNIFYGIILSCNSIIYTLLQYQVNNTANHLSVKIRQSINRKNIFATLLYCLSIPLSLLSIYLSLAVFIMIPAMYFLPSAKLINN